VFAEKLSNFDVCNVRNGGTTPGRGPGSMASLSPLSESPSTSSLSTSLSPNEQVPCFAMV